MSIQSTSFNPLLAQQAGSSPTISALNAGSVFDGRGNDFLSPSDIMGNVDDFSHSIRFGGDALGKNPSAVDVLHNTNSTLSGILNGNFGVNLAAPIVSAPSGGVVGFATPVAITQGTLATNTTILGQVVQTPSPALIRDLSNYNPMIWQNPSPSNIVLGSMDAQNKIFGGSGLFQTGSSTQSSPLQSGFPGNFNQFPLYPYIGLPNAPYSGFSINIPNQGGVTNYQQAALFPTTFVTGSQFYNTYFQPYAVATTQTLIPYQTQVGLAERILGQSGAMSSQMLSSLTPISSSGVPF